MQVCRSPDVLPLPAEDPRGAGLAAGALPLVIGGIVAAVALSLRVQGAARKLAGALGVAVVGGLSMTAILQFWLGSLEGSYWANSGVVALGIAAMSMTAILGLHRLLGVAGLALGAATMILVGNPLSGLSSAPELLPSGWGRLGQLLPPGAVGTALRSVSFFDGAGSGTALLVVSGWLVAGLVLCLVPVGKRAELTGFPFVQDGWPASRSEWSACRPHRSLPPSPQGWSSTTPPLPSRSTPRRSARSSTSDSSTTDASRTH